MRKFKIYLLALILLLNTLLTCSCWNYREISDMTIVAGGGADYDSEKDVFVLTAELTYPSAAEQEIQVLSELITDTGQNVFDAIRTMIRRTGAMLFWGHAKIFIISESLAKNKEKLLSVVDFLFRDAAVRNDIYLLVAKNATPKEILEADIKIQTITSFHLTETFENEKSISKYHAVPLWEFVDSLTAKGISPTLPTVTINEQKEKTIAEIFGTSVFKDGALVGYIDAIETRSYLFIINKLEGGVLVVDEKIDKDFSRVSLEISESKTKVTPTYSNDKFTMNIDIETSVNISEIQGEINFMEEKFTKILKADAEKQLKNQVNSVIKKVQDEFGADIFGFGQIVQYEMPKLWKEIEGDWNDYFEELEVQTNVTINIKGSSLRSKPIKVGE